MGHDPAALRRTVGALHDAACDPDAWPMALDLLAAWCAALGARFLDWDQTRGATAFSRLSRHLDPSGEGPYAAYYGRIDPRLRRLHATPVGRPWSCSEHLTEAEVRRSEFFQDFLRPLGVRYALAARLTAAPGRTTVVVVARGPTTPPFDRAACDRLGALVPHLGWAAELHHRLAPLRQDRGLATAALDRVAEPVLVVAAERTIRFANAAAEAILREGDGLAARAGCLCVGDGAAAKVFAALLARAVAVAGTTGPETGGSVRLPRPSGRADYVLVVTPLPQGAGLAPRAHALVHVIDADTAPRPDPGRLRAAFGLTDAEAALAADLARGARLEEVALARRVALSTVKSQLHALFEKTGTRRQSDLVRLVVRCALT